MLSKGNGLFRVNADQRTAKENATLEKHRWHARLLGHLRRASLHGADWVYFRLECEAGGPKPEIFIYDRTSAGLAGGGSIVEVAQIHHDLWNYGKVPFAFFLRPMAVEVINVLTPPAFDQNGEIIPPKPLDVLPLTAAEKIGRAHV